MVWDGETLLPYNNRPELRKWLLENCSTEKSCWIYCSVKPQSNTILYLDAVEEALCVGWIDGIMNYPAARLRGITPSCELRQKELVSA